MNRRTFLRWSVGLGGAYALGALTGFPRLAAPRPTRVLAGHQPGGFVVPAGEVWGLSGLVTTDGGVTVLGTLVIPAGARLRYLDVDESAFAGGGMDPVASDVGLWVMGAGRLVVQGTPKLAWTWARGADAGAGRLTLHQDPVGWQVGDEVLVTPTLEPSADKDLHAMAHDAVRIAGVQGATVTLDRPLRYAHPAVTLPDGRIMLPEVLNLTRDAGIEGTPSGRAHVFVRSTEPQEIRYAELRYLGPRNASSDTPSGTASIVGRYMLHFHHCHEGSRGSVVEAVVARDGGAHAYVPHQSHGITFRDCISHATVDHAYWWDEGEETDDTLWERCVASATKIGDGDKADSGFLLGAGTGNRAVGCVAVGEQHTSTGSGFQWPSKANQRPNVWEFVDNMAHNCVANGIFVWQNDFNRHIVERFTSFHNGGHGIFHGAYSNRYEYRDVVLYGDRGGGIELRANTRDDDRDQDAYQGPVTFRRVMVDGAGLADYGVVIPDHKVDPEQPTLIEDCEFRGYRLAGVAVTNTSERRTELDLRDVRFSANEFWLASDCNPATLLLYEGLEIRRKDQPGTYRPDWNATVS